MTDIRIVFDKVRQFVEVETIDGRSVRIGRWITHDDTFDYLVLSTNEPVNPTHYVLHSNGRTYVKEADFFQAQGGITSEWGRNWRPVVAQSIEEARQQTSTMTPEQFRQLETGDIIRHVSDYRSMVVVENYGNRVTAIATADVTNPEEWVIVRKK